MNYLLLLATLLDGPKHGYALKKRAGLITGHAELHNNLVYPLLKRFMAEGWVSKRIAKGQRGQTRDVYALTSKGKLEIIRRLSQFGEKEVREPNAFRLRVGLFSMLPVDTQQNILATRDRWLGAEEQKLTRLQSLMELGKWGVATVRFLLEQVHHERKWIKHLQQKALSRDS